MTNTQSAIHHNVNPSEVGWQFVPKYYTFLNQQPNRLHCFYTKASTFIHGVEGEDGKPCHGQLEIHNKITSMGFQDCKVFIHSVDAQSSANGGITILVIGEMSNHNGPWRKFVQSFFLAEQPNGYFVLNDMFRFLKEETVEDDDVSESEGVAVAPEVAPTPAEIVIELTPESSPPPYESQTPAPVTPAPPSPVSVVEEVPVPAPAEPEPASPTLVSDSQPQTNGIHTTETEAPAPQSPVEESPVPVPAQLAPQPAPTASSPVVAAATLPPATPAVAPTAPLPPQQQQQGAASQPVASSAPAVPPAPRTWANLAATNLKKWGNAVAQESRGTTEVPAAANTPPASGTQTPATAHGPGMQRGHGQHQHQHQHPHQHQHQHQHQHPHPHQNQHPHQYQHGRGEHPAIVAVQNLTTPQCFAKGVTEPITSATLTNVLMTRFGPIKDLEIVRSKACAFFEFHQLEAAKKAITTSLPQSQGGEGGIWIDVGGDIGPIRISVETRKERGERPVSRPRGGAPPNGESRGGGGGGGFRGGRGGARGRGGSAPAAK